MADPLYLTIAEELRAQITSGRLPAGTQLPTESELMDTHQASRNTIRDAIRWLSDRGFVERQRGRGTFVVDKIVPFVVTLSADRDTGFGGGEGMVYVAEAEAHGRMPESSDPRVEVRKLWAENPEHREIAEHLEISIGDQVVSRHQERRIDGKPWSLQTSFYPWRFVEMGATDLLLATDIKPGVVAYLKEKLQIEQVGYRDVITVRGPNEVESSFFRLASTGTTSVLHTVRTAYDGEGRPFRVTVTVFPGDRNRLAFDVGRVPERVASADGSRAAEDDLSPG